VYFIGIDVGGTFTDLVAVDDVGTTTLAKTPTTPSDQTIGVFNGLDELARALGTERSSLLAQTHRIVHGTTVATNALLEQKGVKVGLLTTSGHRDILEMREGLKEDRYNLRMAPPDMIVPRDLRFDIKERIGADGEVLVPLDKESVQQAIQDMRANGIEAVAICFLHSYRSPDHERQAAEIVQAEMPGIYVSLSSDVLPQIKEFDRFSTTVVNAYIGPILSRYLKRLEQRLIETGYTRPLLIIQSHGGVASVEEAARTAAGCVLSGPAGGVSASKHITGLLSVPNLISFDMGGTSTDFSLIEDGEVALSTNRNIGGHRVALNSLDIVTLGAGGGSIAQVDRGGLLKVGPESAGASPGPACYQRGGNQATVTDANVTLGYLDASRELGGGTVLSQTASDAVLEKVGEGLGADRLQAAHAIYRIVNSKMADGIRLVSVRRGVDPRKFALLSFGGASGMHIAEVARETEISRVIVPRAASVLSAWGMLTTDLRVETVRSLLRESADVSAADIATTFDTMETESAHRLKDLFEGELTFARSAEMRYGEQIFEINVPLADIAWDSDNLIEQMVDRFHARHEAIYGYALREQSGVVVNLKSAIVCKLPTLPVEPKSTQTEPARPSRNRKVYTGSWVEIPVYDFDELTPGSSVAGPAAIESAMTTVLLYEGDIASVTTMGWLDIAIAPRKIKPD
jgi:N-methylhydantoinase A